MKKQEIKYTFNSKRNKKIVTPCCGKLNKDGKFANYKELPENFGHCHSCGKTTLPPTIYINDLGEEQTWNDELRKFEPLTNNASVLNQQTATKLNNTSNHLINQSFIPESIIWKYYEKKPENNLLKYMRATYGNKATNLVKEQYVLGTTNDGGVIFWNINKDLKIQKAKVAYYKLNGRRKQFFKQPYKNENGYYSCLFGEHLILDSYRGKQIIILVESEKTAVIGSLLLPKYTWLSYGGSTGLTERKYECLVGHTVLIVPDISNKDVEIMKNKTIQLRKIGVNANLWDMTKGRSDEELERDGIYNCDLEDVFRHNLSNQNATYKFTFYNHLTPC